MEQFGEAYESLNEVKKRFETKYPDFQSSWKQMVKTTGVELVNEIKDKLKIEYQFFKQLKDFQFRFVVDNNFIFGQIKGTLKKKGKIEDSFLYKLLLSKSVQIFAPPKLQDELTSKIQLVLSEEDRELALRYALLLTSKIKIQDAQWIDEWKKANRLIGESDSDDVPYLALAFAVDSHAIISFDKVFHNQGDLKVWQFGDTDKIITNYHSGILSFAVAGATTQLLAYLISLVGKVIRDILLDLLSLIKQLANGVIKAISKIQPELIVILTALGILTYFSSPEYQKKGKELALTLGEIMKEALKKLKEIINSLSEYLSKFIDFIEPFTVPTIEFLGYLMAQYIEMEKELEKLEIKRG